MSRGTAAIALALVVGTVSSGVAQDAILRSARQLREAGEPEASLAVLERTLEREGSTPALAAELGLTEAQLGRWDAAAAHLHQALAEPDDPHVAQHRDEIRRTLAEAEASLAAAAGNEEPPEPAPASEGPAEPSTDPFAQDTDPDAPAPPTPSAPPEEPPEVDLRPAPGRLPIPNELRSTLTAEGPPAAPLTRTGWVRPARTLRLIGIFGDFGAGTAGPLTITGDPGEWASSRARRFGGRLGVEVNLPLVPSLFATVRVFGGVTYRSPDTVYLFQLERISDPSFAAVFSEGTWSGALLMPSFGGELLARHATKDRFTIGAGVRFAASAHSESLGYPEVAALRRDAGCDFSKDTPGLTAAGGAGEYYDCSEPAVRLSGDQADRFSRDWRAWFLELQAVLELELYLTTDRRVALRLSLALGRPVVTGSVGLAFALGPSMGTNR